ncbi:MAG: hypothetical protein K9L59_14385 [Desulfobacterales bacterium]|nr:hypothetical protein [Desulfobacterales bacterium]
MKRLAAIFFLAAGVFTWLAFKSESPGRRKRLAAAAAVCWIIVVVGFLV